MMRCCLYGIKLDANFHLLKLEVGFVSITSKSTVQKRYIDSLLMLKLMMLKGSVAHGTSYI